MALLSVRQAERLEGSISEGTLRTEDLGESVFGLLSEIARKVRGANGKAWRERLAALLSDWRSVDPDEDEAPEIVDDAFALVNEALPPGFVCEASEGDGASFGVWRAGSEEDDTSDHPCAKCGILTAPDPLCPRCDPTFAARYGGAS